MLKKLYIKLLVVLIITLFLGYIKNQGDKMAIQQKQQETEQVNNDINWTKCPKIRPEMCAEIYQPVLGKLKDGNVKKFSNSCKACANHEVTHYSPIIK